MVTVTYYHFHTFLFLFANYSLAMMWKTTVELRKNKLQFLKKNNFSKAKSTEQTHCQSRNAQQSPRKRYKSIKSIKPQHTYFFRRLQKFNIRQKTFHSHATNLAQKSRHTNISNISPQRQITRKCLNILILLKHRDLFPLFDFASVVKQNLQQLLHLKIPENGSLQNSHTVSCPQPLETSWAALAKTAQSERLKTFN